MSKRDSPEALELPLYDLPLRGVGAAGEASPEEAGLSGLDAVATQIDDAGDLPLAPSLGDRRAPADVAPDRTYVESRTRELLESSSECEPTDHLDSGDDEESPAPLRDRWMSGLLDLGIQLLVLSAAMAAVRWMNVSLSLDEWAPFAALGLIFSFLYWFIPLAFWGQTPGMAWVGNSAMNLSSEPLTFGQSVLRWIGALFTLAFLGLPVLLVLGGDGRSLTDRLSDSKTVVLAP